MLHSKTFTVTDKGLALPEWDKKWRHLQEQAPQIEGGLAVSYFASFTNSSFAETKAFLRNCSKFSQGKTGIDLLAILAKENTELYKYGPGTWAAAVNVMGPPAFAVCSLTNVTRWVSRKKVWSAECRCAAQISHLLSLLFRKISAQAKIPPIAPLVHPCLEVLFVICANQGEEYMM